MKMYLNFSAYQIRRLSVSSVLSSYGPSEVQRCTLSNGLKIVSAKPTGAQLAACTIMFQAGSRYEQDDQIGATHFIRAMSNATGNAYSGFSKLRFLPQHGAYMSCASDRQSISFTLRCPYVCFNLLKNYLLDAASRCKFYQWELADRVDLIKGDLSRIHPEARVIDLVQQACWKGPLSNSVFCPRERIDDMLENSLKCYATKYFVAEECSIGSVGITFEQLLAVAQNFEDYGKHLTCPVPREEILSSPRGAFGHYDLGPDSDTWVAIAVPSCGANNIEALLKHAIIAESCGTGNLQTGQHTLDKIAQPPLGDLAGQDMFTTFKAFNISYKETGLFGILTKAKASRVKHAALSAVQFLKNIKDLTSRQIEIGKQRLKVNLALHDDDCGKVSEGLALQMAYGHLIDSAKSAINMVDKMPEDDVLSVAKGLCSNPDNIAIAVVGDIGAVPHNEDLRSA